MKIIDVLLLFTIYALWTYGIRKFILNYYRQKLFEIRAKLFDDVASVSIGLTFSSEAYIETREFINYKIRFAHRYSYPQILLVKYFVGDKLKDEIKESQRKFDSVINSSKEKTYLKHIVDDVNRVTLKHVFLYSPIVYRYFLSKVGRYNVEMYYGIR